MMGVRITAAVVIAVLSFSNLIVKRNEIRSFFINNGLLSVSVEKLDTQNQQTDHIVPEVELKSADTEFYIDDAVVTLKSREPLVLNDRSGKIYEFKDQKGHEYYYELVSPLNSVGTNTFTFSLSDKSNNSIDNSIQIKKVGRDDQNVPMPYIESFKNSFILADPANYKLTLDASKRLPADYVPSDMVNLRSLGIDTVDTEFLRKEAAEQLKKMKDDMAKVGIKFVVTSAYRSYQYQISTYNIIKATEGESVAILKAAKPGYSEHQLGLAVDLVNEETHYQLPKKGETSRLYEWLKANGPKYGFYQSHNGQQGDFVMEELWHWRYNGKN